MKILISVDIEGVAGVYHSEQVRPGNPEFERARRLMTAEANAAVCGAFDAGASEVFVNDSHGGFRNMPPDLLDERAQVIQGKPRYLSMVSGVELGVAGVCLVGYHSRAQGRGILAHTINSFAFARVKLNGMELGEAGIYGALAGAYGVPVLMGSGDDAFIEETRLLFPQAVYVQTKRATGQGSGISLSPALACSAIRTGVAQAVQQLLCVLAQLRRVHAHAQALARQADRQQGGGCLLAGTLAIWQAYIGQTAGGTQVRIVQQLLRLADRGIG